MHSLIWDELTSLKQKLQLEYAIRTRLQKDWERQRNHFEQQIKTLRAEINDLKQQIADLTKPKPRNMHINPW